MQEEEQTEIDSDNVVYTNLSKSENSSQNLVPVMKTNARGFQGFHQGFYSLLDTGSSASFITGRLLPQLSYKVVQKNVALSISQLENQKIRKSMLVEIDLLPFHGKPIRVKAFVVDQLLRVPGHDAKFPKGIGRLNDEFPRGPIEVDLLLGITDVSKVIKGIHQFPGSSSTFLKTAWGVVPCGVTAFDEEDFLQPVETNVFMSGTEQLAYILEKMWKYEELPMDSNDTSLSREELSAIDKINEVLKFNPERGRYETGLLWRDQPDLINNYGMAKARQESLEKKLKKDDKVYEMYTNAIQEFFDNDVAEEVFDEDYQNPLRTDLFYLPHRPFIDESRITTICRPVFDGSAKTATGRSLNSCLHPGPPLQRNIVTIELKFRQHQVAVCADISKMFLTVDIREEDRDYLRFLWRDPRSNDPVKVYRFKTLIFGATDSPFQAISCLHDLIKRTLEKPDVTEEEKEACQILMDDTYVDDVTTGGPDVFSVMRKINAIKTLLKSVGFKIRKFATNSEELLKQIPEEERAPTETVDFSNDLNDHLHNIPLSTLGIRWDPASDQFLFNQYADLKKENKNTKTSVASLLAKLYDPLGFISPFVMAARMVLKQTFADKLGWKEELQGEALQQWNQWVDQLEDMKDLKFPRYVPIDETTTFHVFGDASPSAGFGVAVYTRTFCAEKNEYETHLLLARARVAPLKADTTPKLELRAALLASEISKYLCEELKFEKTKISCYSDSEIVLYWMQKEPAILIPFVAHKHHNLEEEQHRCNR